RLNAVIDLRDRNTLAALQLSSADLRFNFRSVPSGAAATATQLLGERCAALGRVDGIFYPSFATAPAVLATPSTNLAVIEASLAALGSTLEVNDPQNSLHDRLP
ncbi:MAG: hypothetical protein ACREQL_11815, partial [Candidatus Binatia bacterium]